MKKLFALLVAIALVASFASAQDFYGQGKMSYGAGAGISLPMGSVGDVYGLGIGGFVLGQYGLTPEVLGTAQVGYTMFMEKEVSGVKSKMSAVTILVGGKYDLSKIATPGLYGSLQLGLYMASTTVTVPAVTFFGVTVGGGEVTGSGSEFVFAPGVGYQMGNLDFSVRYVINSAVGNLGVNVAYVMPL
jgi:hypothetical protein